MRILLYLKSKDFTYGGPAYVCQSTKSFFIKYKLVNNFQIEIKDDNDYKNLTRKALEKEISNYDIVSIHGIWSFKNSLLAKTCRKMFIPYTISLHGMLDPWSWKKNLFFKFLFYLFYLRKDFKYASSIHCLNKFEFNLTKKYLKKNNVYIFENLLDDSAYRISEKLLKKKPKGEVKILYFGRITEKKGLDKFITAIKKNDKNFLLNIVGPANTKEDKEYLLKLKKLTQKFNLNKKIIFSNPVSQNEKKSDIINSSDFFLLPSMAEGDSVALKESVLHGLPLLITKNCKFEVEYNNKIFGYYLKDDFSNANKVIETIINMGEINHFSMRLNAIKFSEKFKINQKKISELFELYENITRSKNNKNINRVS